MAKLNVKDIKDLARSIVAAKPGGIQRIDLSNEILQLHPEIPKKNHRKFDLES